MRKILFAIVCCFIFISVFNLKALAAEDLNIDVNVSGKVAKGENIQIKIDLYNISNFYAGSIDFKYDPSIFKIKSIEKGELITQKDANGKEIPILEVFDKNLEDGIASYGFTCIGKSNGFSGSNTFVIINAEIQNKDSFYLKSQPFLKEPSDEFNIKMKIVDTNLKELSYTFNSYKYDAETDTEVTSQASSREMKAETTGNNQDASSNSTDNNISKTIGRSAASDRAADSTAVEKKGIIKNIVDFLTGRDNASPAAESNNEEEGTDNANYKVSKTIYISLGAVFVLGLTGIFLIKNFRNKRNK